MNKSIAGKELTLLVVLSFVVFTISAQDYTRPATEVPPSTQQDKKFSLGFSIGSAIPLRDFGSTKVNGSFWDANSTDSTKLQGFAKTGFHFSITASYLFSDEVGLMIMFGSSSNPFDAGTFSSTIGVPTSPTSGNYTVSEYLIGPYLSFAATPKLNIKIGAMIGLVSIGYPELNLALNDTITETIDFQGGLNFGYSALVGLEYNISNSVAIALNISYTGSNITYGSWTQSYNIIGYYPLSFSHPTDQTTMASGILKQTIGLVIKL